MDHEDDILVSNYYQRNQIILFCLRILNYLVHLFSLSNFNI